MSKVLDIIRLMEKLNDHLGMEHDCAIVEEDKDRQDTREEGASSWCYLRYDGETPKGMSFQVRLDGDYKRPTGWIPMASVHIRTPYTSEVRFVEASVRAIAGLLVA